MSEGAIAARLIEALVAEAGAQAKLVSVSVEMLGAGEAARVEARIERRTRTLVFAQADAFDEGGARIASATSIHRVG
jgi:hypothetical protein